MLNFSQQPQSWSKCARRCWFTSTVAHEVTTHNEEAWIYDDGGGEKKGGASRHDKAFLRIDQTKLRLDRSKMNRRSFWLKISDMVWMVIKPKQNDFKGGNNAAWALNTMHNTQTSTHISCYWRETNSILGLVQCQALYISISKPADPSLTLTLAIIKPIKRRHAERILSFALLIF